MIKLSLILFIFVLIILQPFNPIYSFGLIFLGVILWKAHDKFKEWVEDLEYNEKNKFEKIISFLCFNGGWPFKFFGFVMKMIIVFFIISFIIGRIAIPLGGILILSVPIFFLRGCH